MIQVWRAIEALKVFDLLSCIFPQRAVIRTPDHLKWKLGEHRYWSIKNGSLIAAMSSGVAICPSGVMVLSEVAGFAPHDGVRWRIVSNVVCGVSRRTCVPTVFTRSTNLRPFGTSLPAAGAGTQIRQWPPVSIDYFLLCALLLTSFPYFSTSARGQASENADLDLVVGCMSMHESRHRAYSCIGNVTDLCLEALGRSTNANFECLDREATAWNQIYSTSVSSLRTVTQRDIPGSIQALEEAIVEYEGSYLRDCIFEVGRWPENAVLRNIDSFQCVRNGSAERALSFFFWDLELRILTGE